MRSMQAVGLAAVVLGTALGFVPRAAADEGMWLFSNPPTQLVQERYGFQLTPEWLEHVQKSCVRFGAGGSGSIVSPYGLVMTNHHVGFGQFYKLTTPERDIIRDGYLARTLADELPCKDLELWVLWSIEDVTADVRGASDGKQGEQAVAARKARIAEIEQQCKEATGLTGEVVTLYNGARYHLYRYKVYTDVRLVFAPESQAAAFGGDVDNFEYPRYALDVSYFRIYEDGKPLRPENYLKWSRSGASENDLVFAAGHPGKTRRGYTVAHSTFMRDHGFPRILETLWRREVKLLNFADRSPEQAQMASGDLSGTRNSRKAFTGMLAGLQEPALLDQKRAEESALRQFVAQNPALQAEVGDAWDDIAGAEERFATFLNRYHMFADRGAPRSSLLATAQRLVRLASELPKPNAERLDGYHDAELDSLYRQLYSPAPIYDALEIERLSSALSQLAEEFGEDDLLVAPLLDGKSPKARAVQLVRETRLRDIAERRRLAEAGPETILASDDPMLRFASTLEPAIRAFDDRYDSEVDAVEREAYARIAKARFAMKGENDYPDATFTLRLTFGRIAGYEENGTTVPPFTRFRGMFERMDARDGAFPFNLPGRWLERKGYIDLSTPFDFVSTLDVVGGNSGSPVFNRKAEVVGLVFDGNIQSLVWDAAYTSDQARTVSVDARALIEALKSVYEADGLVAEILDGEAPSAERPN